MRRSSRRSLGPLLAGISLLLLGGIAILCTRLLLSRVSLGVAQRAHGLTSSMLRAIALHGAHTLFPSYQPLAIYVYHPPLSKTDPGPPAQVLVVLGRRGRAFFYMSEYATRVGTFSGAGTGPESGWTIAAPVSPRVAVRPRSLREVPGALHAAIARWSSSICGPVPALTVWQFPGSTLVVQKVHRQDIAATFASPDTGPTVILGAAPVSPLCSSH